ncbi:uncharacterized protein LOC130050770 isoform X2 [Ostrea edulis]|uniref:uncharacterized protein LOC130050770 isoform X2 n=1 Tax=Ostrea edulis TaxID=37623 RepID=UPI0024AEA5D7|nr:uncharacterized protein LOC130050770 isoform X2 [Ostrea edulis]
MIIVVTLVCILTLHTSQCASYRYTNTSCLETYKLDKTNKDKITCTGEHVVNHCIPDDQHKEMEVCVEWKWITPGYCPYYDKLSDAIKEEGCTSYCLWNEDLFDVCKCSSTFNKNGSCKKKCEDAFGSYKYIFCEHENVPHLDTTTVNGTLGGYDTTHSQESQTNDGTIWIIIGITVSVVVLLAIIIAVIIAVVAVRRRIKKRRHSRGDNETQEMVTFIEENQRERNNSGNVDVEMHVPSVTDQSSNQTVKDDSNDEKKEIQTHADDNSGDENAELEDVVVDNTLRESDNGGGSSNNVTMKHVDEQEHQSNIADTHLNSSADSGSDQDGNEDTSKDNIVTEGIFVDSPIDSVNGVLELL